MSMASQLKKRAGPRVRVRAAPSERSSSGGTLVKLVLMPPTSGRLGDVFEIARLLVRTGVPVRTARKAIDELTIGRTAYVEARSVTDYALLKRRMASHNVAAHRIELRPVDVKAVRARLGISQEAFAGRYGLDVATVRNWEQGRTKPEGPAAALLQLIDRTPGEGGRAAGIVRVAEAERMPISRYIAVAVVRCSEARLVLVRR
jgi:DNA-binding transcriptional regulator YiaG